VETKGRLRETKVRSLGPIRQEGGDSPEREVGGLGRVEGQDKEEGYLGRMSEAGCSSAIGINRPVGEGEKGSRSC